jgi:hypothetical protein
MFSGTLISRRTEVDLVSRTSLRSSESCVGLFSRGGSNKLHDARTRKRHVNTVGEALVRDFCSARQKGSLIPQNVIASLGMMTLRSYGETWGHRSSY